MEQSTAGMARADALPVGKGCGAIRKWSAILRGLKLSFSSQDQYELSVNESFPARKVGAAELGPTLLKQTQELSLQDEVQRWNVHAFLLLVLWSRYGVGSLLGF